MSTGFLYLAFISGINKEYKMFKIKKELVEGLLRYPATKAYREVAVIISSGSALEECDYVVKIDYIK